MTAKPAPVVAVAETFTRECDLVDDDVIFVLLDRNLFPLAGILEMFVGFFQVATQRNRRLLEIDGLQALTYPSRDTCVPQVGKLFPDFSSHICCSRYSPLLIKHSQIVI